MRVRTIGWTSVVVLLGTWAALDDITTDTAQSFQFEYTGLVLSGLWFAGLAAWLAARRRRVLCVASLAAIAVGTVAFWSLPHRGEPVSAVNLLGYIPLAWFLALTVWLLVGRSGRVPPVDTDPSPAATP